MHRGEWLLIGVQDKDETHWLTPLCALERASRFRGNVCLDNVHERFSAQSTGLTLVHLLTLHRSGRSWQRTPTYLFRSERSSCELSRVR
jgi:hypothetical protein